MYSFIEGKIADLNPAVAVIDCHGIGYQINISLNTYTNIAGFDDDVESYGLLRLTPHSPWKPLHKAQAWYFPVVYSFIAFDFIARDFLMVVFGKSDANHVYPKMNAVDKLTFWGGKLFFFMIMIGLPLLVFPWWQVLIGFLIVMLTVGLVMGVVFQLAHISADDAFPPAAAYLSS